MTYDAGENIMDESNWKRVWDAPSLRKEPIGELSARYRYKAERSKERFLKRDDAPNDYFTRRFTGEVGRTEGIRIITI